MKEQPTIENFGLFCRQHHPAFEYFMEKEITERMRNLIGDPFLMSVYQRFGVEPFRRSSALYGLDNFLQKINARGKGCIEIGSWHGITAVILSRYFDHVWTYDIIKSSLRQQIIEMSGVKNVTCIVMPNLRSQREDINSREFDFAYVDGDHAKNTEWDFNSVKGCGRVLFDEAWPVQSPVWSLVKSLPENQVVYSGQKFAYWSCR